MFALLIACTTFGLDTWPDPALDDTANAEVEPGDTADTGVEPGDDTAAETPFDCSLPSHPEFTRSVADPSDSLFVTSPTVEEIAELGELDGRWTPGETVGLSFVLNNPTDSAYVEPSVAILPDPASILLDNGEQPGPLPGSMQAARLFMIPAQDSAEMYLEVVAAPSATPETLVGFTSWAVYLGCDEDPSGCLDDAAITFALPLCAPK